MFCNIYNNSKATGQLSSGAQKFLFNNEKFSLIVYYIKKAIVFQEDSWRYEWPQCRKGLKCSGKWTCWNRYIMRD